MAGIVVIVKLGLALVFAVAGVTKLMDRPGTRKAVEEFSAPAALAPALAWLLPAFELVVAAMLLTGPLGWWGALGALVSLGLFNVAIGANMARGRTPDCHCFGQLHSAPIGWKTLTRNFALMGGAGLALWAGKDTPGVLETVAAKAVDPDGGVLLALIALAVAGVEGRLLYQAHQENRRLTERLEALETRVSHGSAGAQSVLGVEPGTVPKGLPVGTEAPVFALPDLHGEPQSLDTHLDLMRPVILVFVSPTCPPCQELAPELVRWHETMSDRLTLVLISTGKPNENREAYAQYGPLPILLQRRSEVLDQYQAVSTPSAVLIYANGLLGSAVAGGPRAIRALITGVDAELERTFKPVFKAMRRQLNPEPTPLPIGAEAPFFSLPDLGGRTHTLAQHRGEELVILFFSPACGYCQRMMPELGALSKSGPRGPQVVVVTVGSAEESRAWVDEHSVRCLVLLQGDENLPSAYGATGTPMGYLIDAEGRIASELAVGAEALLALARRDDPAVLGAGA